MRRIVPLVLFVIGIVASSLAAPRAFAQQLDVIRGRVTGPEGTGIVNVRVKATSYNGNVAKSTTTDKNGRYSITYPNGEGDYWLEFNSIGFVAKRFEVKRIADEEILIADTKLVSSIATLDALNVTANGPRALVNRNAPNPNAGGNETALNSAAVSPDQLGNLAALASGLPGIQLIPGLDGAADVFSALGLSADQNSTTFNGLGSAVSVLPSDAQVNASVATYSYDPSRGQFSGGTLMLTSRSGSNFSSRQASTNAVAPSLQFADNVAEAQDQKYSYVTLGFGGGGPIIMDRDFYNASFQASKRFKDFPSLLNTSPLGLSSAGVAADSVTHLLGILGSLGIPASVEKTPKQQVQDQYLTQGNFDISPSDNGTGNGFTVNYYGNYSKTGQIGGNSILTTPAHNGEAQNWAGQVAIKQSAYFWDSFLSTTNLGVQVTGQENSPYLRLPSGNVRVNSMLDDSTSALRVLQFGGNSFLNLNTQAVQGELSNVVSWYAGNNRHSVKLTTDVRQENVTATQATNLYGTYSYNSLSELEAGQPASFTRTLNAPKQNGSQLTGAMSLGDYWRPSNGVQIQYGVRLDGNKFEMAPDRNQLVQDRLGLRNDYLPNKLYASPRVGFTWYYGNQDQIAFLPGSARPPRAVVQGGFGMFQSLRASDLASGAVSNTGLAKSTQQITCNGPATPSPSWNTYELRPETIPATCADGTNGSQFANTTPNVTLFDRDYVQARSWRGNLTWSGPVLDNRFALGVQTVYSLNMNQPDAVDRNFTNVQRFALANEGGRPVFANVSAIDPRTGLIAVQDTRKTTDFLRVNELRSDLRSDAKQFVVTLKPVTANPKFNWTAAYQLAAYRDQYRGFSSTVGDPFDKQWGRSLQPGRHQISVGFSSIPVFDIVYISWNLSFLSGARYTPSISGDVNGDGSFNNDRAFVFNPSSIADSAFRAGMTSLLNGGTTSAKQCLATQLNKLATRGSCVSPWTTNANLQFRFNPQKIGLPKRTTIYFTLNNPLGLADLIVHGQDIHGWGQQIAPDPALLFVRGFNPQTKRYNYEVNQRFGSTRPTQSTNRQLAYFSLRVQVDVGVARERQVLSQRLDIGRGKKEGTKMTAPMLKSLGSSTIPNPMALILQQPDSLKLTRKQADSLAALSRLFTQRADALWTPVSKKLEALPDQYSQDKAYAEYVAAREKTVDYLITLVPDVKKLLTSSQKRKLPPQLMNYLDVRVLKFLRSSSAGDGSQFFIR
jgi:hypothetical protein